MEDGVPAPADEPRRTLIEQLARDLRALRASVGNPSFRKMAGLSGYISHTTLHEAATGSRLPSWQTTREFVRACGGDEGQWRSRWLAAKNGVADSETSRPDDDDGEASSVVAEEPWSGSQSPAEATASSSRPNGETGDAAGGAADSRSGAEPNGQAGDEPEQLGSVRAAAGAGARTGRGFRRWRWLVAGFAVVLVLGVAAGGVVIGRQIGSHARLSPPLHPGDDVQFSDDVTFPDGSRVAPGERFLKVWELENTGGLAWRDRFLVRQGPEQSRDCRTPKRVPVGPAWPGERVKISVPVIAPETPGPCMVRWKMVDAEGRQLFPGARPVYFLVEVGG